MPTSIRILHVSEENELAEPKVANPFKYDHSKHSTCCQTFKMILIGLVLFLPRFIFFFIFLLLMWFTAAIASCCAPGPVDGMQFPVSMPVSRFFIRVWVRCILFCLGYWWISVDGDFDETAPVIVANHVSFVDAFLMGYLALPMAVAKAAVLTTPIIGSIARALQTLPVSREDKSSRHGVGVEISRRTRWAVDQPAEVQEKYPQWPPLLIFPEATCTNQNCIIEFKKGAFAPLMPVQPVCIDLRQKYLDISWVGSMNPLRTLVRMMCQIYNRVQITCLPVFRPTMEELQAHDVESFMDRIRCAVADALQVPLTNHNFLDTLLAQEVKLLKLPTAQFNVGMGGYPDGLEHAKEKLKEFAKVDKNRDGALSPKEFADLLGFPEESELEERERIAEAIIAQWDQDGDGKIDFREFLLFSAWRKLRRAQTARLSRITASGVFSPSPSRSVYPGEPIADDEDHLSSQFLEDQELRHGFAFVFGAFDVNHDGKMTREEFLNGIERISLSSDVAPLFDSMDANGDGVVDLDEWMHFADKHPYLICSLLNAIEPPGDGVTRSKSVVFENEEVTAGITL